MTYAKFPTIFSQTHSSSGTLLNNITVSWPSLVSSFVINYDISDRLPVLSLMEFNNSLNNIGNNGPFNNLKHIYNKVAINTLRNLRLTKILGQFLVTMTQILLMKILQMFFSNIAKYEHFIT